MKNCGFPGMPAKSPLGSISNRTRARVRKGPVCGATNLDNELYYGRGVSG